MARDFRDFDDEDDGSPFDRNGLLKDGRTARFTMLMHDSGSVGRAVAASKQHVHDGRYSEFGLNKPGPRYNDAADYSEAERAYHEAGIAQADAWRAGPGGGQQDAQEPMLGSDPNYRPAPGLKVGEFIRQREGDFCTVNGEPGQLVRGKDGQLVCRATPRRDSAPATLDWRTTDLGRLTADAERIKQQAYDAACAEASEAWKRLGSL